MGVLQQGYQRGFDLNAVLRDVSGLVRDQIRQDRVPFIEDHDGTFEIVGIELQSP